eukprot:TRINITY_DN22265_c0_g1_i1.p1 TRINITY_DN22265_c0_g1~~TRINITY_DN22265_c0_g1_i1.p1  ORF type:complete len:171 (-),score=35.95 TRINITY_DN22265_c0_g1_i1:8-520(-)
MLLAQKHHISQLHSSITEQSHSLHPLAEVLPEFCEHYEGLVHELHTSALRMPISGVSVDQHAIAQALGDSQGVLDSIVALLRGKPQSVGTAAHTLQNLDSVLKRAKSELVSCKALLEGQQALQIEERSLISHCAQICQEVAHNSEAHTTKSSARSPKMLRAPFSPFTRTP